MSSLDISTIPPLQVFSRLSAHVFGGATPRPTPEALRLLGEYLQSQSCNLGEVEVLRQWDQQNRGDDASLKDIGVDLEAVQHTVSSRAAAVRAVLAENKEKISVIASTASAGGVGGRGRAAVAEGNRGPSTSVVQWWHLGTGSPWGFALDTSDRAEESSMQVDYHFVCLRDAVEVMEPFLSGMRCAAALGAEDEVSTIWQQGTDYITRVCARGEPVAVFAVLELARTYVTLAFGGRSGVAGVERALHSTRALDEMRRVESLMERFDIKEGDGQETHQPTPAADPTAGTLTKAQAYWSLAASYSVFFHTVAAYVDGVSGNFEKFAAAVLGTGDRPALHLWGASRFPFIPFALPENNTAGHSSEAKTNASKAAMTVHTRLATLFPPSSSHVTGSGADYYLAEYKPLVTEVITPAATFSTLLLLSAVATLPLHVVTKRLPLWVELRELHENCEDLNASLRALHDGQLGTAWRSATAAATRYLANSPHIHPTVLQQLLESVKRALCFHYLNTRDVTDIAHAAEDLCFASTKEFMDAVTVLIRDQYIDARVDLVSGAIQVLQAGSIIRDEEGTAEAMSRAVIGLSTLEMQLTCMSAERNLIFIPAGLDD
ncbi:hypothetical protein ABB37_03169 [Leptomonas pyrrhocoris]|uniref:Uncharacterized protein n=1 Tax=Leptomonas pyrrhocoris TaxID=157538 RepID=A0A0M9G4J7_LEPPY|nr:hypothetical protein ABB37_03169 [Leptomonas pyrrhocoris]KPA81986.1 hypothetical protein ABB37_03169 [Leptomonas pyrrhocoris]|eukprot:XP_015660425.1 hypothetical protein ABB37_03169 [Leptomonas pyrrhocoris]